MDQITILIADDHELVRRGIRGTLETESHCKVVAEASNGREAVELCRELRPGIAVLDLNMPQLSGLDAIREIAESAPGTKVLAVSFDDGDHLIRQVLGAGAKGYVLKSDAARDLATAVQALAEGRTFFTSKVSDALMDSYLSRGLGPAPPERSQLTAREQEILRLVADGKANKEIATKLNISVRTVETHRRNFMEKAGLHSTRDVILYALQHGLSGDVGGAALRL